MVNYLILLIKLILFLQFSLQATQTLANEELDSQKQPSLTESSENAGIWLELELGIIGSASSEILENAIEKVKESKYKGLIIILDTPGGALESTRSMVKSILAAPFPIIVWVGPSGARAGSAGSFITLSAHVASMAPGTNIGAATPVQISGNDISEKSDLKKKIENDTVAFMESIADVRSRNKEMAVSFVVNALSITAKEALDNNLIDFMADNPQQLLLKANGIRVKIDGQDIKLNTSADTRVSYDKNIRELFLEVLSNPNLFYLLFIAGIIGIGIELTNPGVLIPGVLGGISLIVALIATSVIPISFGAMALIVVSIGFMIAEVFLPSFGILGIGGFIGFLIGSVLLIDSDGLAVSWFTIGPVAFAVAGFSLIVFYLVYKTEKSQLTSGQTTFTGQHGKAVVDFQDGVGKVQVEGEFWSAKCVEGESIKKGDKITVKQTNGLELIVTKLT